MAASETAAPVLFVCTGNVHRSVLAERLLAVHAPGVRVASAGTRAVPGAPLDPATRSVLAELGGDGTGFASRRLTEELVAGSRLVLGMEREHREAAVRLSPLALRRCFTLKEFLRLGGDADRRGTAVPVPAGEDAIADPWGEPYGVLEECGREIDAVVAALARLLSHGAAGGACS